METPTARPATTTTPVIPYVAEQDYPERLRPLLDPYITRMGFLPNALKVYMHRPEIAEVLWTLNNRIMRDPSSTLDPFLKRRLAVVCCTVNGCAYCTAHTCAILKRPAGIGAEGWGMSEEELTDLVTGRARPADAREKACFDYVRAASSDPSNVPDSVLAALARHLSPAQIVELACLVGFWKFYNTVHDSLHIPIEEELVDDARYVALAPR